MANQNLGNALEIALPNSKFSLNFIFKEFNLNQPTKVKIDVDGNEKEVFASTYDVSMTSNNLISDVMSSLITFC